MTILGLVATGLGISILPASFRRARLADLVWLPLSEEDAISELWLVWSAGREMDAQIGEYDGVVAGKTALKRAL